VSLWCPIRHEAWKAFSGCMRVAKRGNYQTYIVECFSLFSGSKNGPVPYVSCMFTTVWTLTWINMWSSFLSWLLADIFLYADPGWNVYWSVFILFGWHLIFWKLCIIIIVVIILYYCKMFISCNLFLFLSVSFRLPATPLWGNSFTYHCWLYFLIFKPFTLICVDLIAAFELIDHGI